MDAVKQTARSGTYTYAAGTDAKLAAIPRPGYRFTGWSGSTSDITETITLSMTCAKDVTASFAAGKFRVNTSVNPAASGSIELSPPQPAEGYSAGTLVTIAARPAEGYTLKEWSGSMVGSKPANSIIIESENTINAVFMPRTSAAWNWVWGGAGIAVIGILAYLVVSGRR